MRVLLTGVVLLGAFAVASAQNADTARLPGERSAASADSSGSGPGHPAAAIRKDTAGNGAAKAKAGSTEVTVQKTVHMSELDRFLDMWR